MTTDERDCFTCAHLRDTDCQISRGCDPNSDKARTCERLYPAKFARLCKDCPTATFKACRHVFGRLWHDKSWGGVGCRHPEKIDDYAAKWMPADAAQSEMPPPPPEAAE